MSKTNLRILSVITSLAILAGAAVATSYALLASAETGGPTVVLSSTSSSSTNAASVPVTATFSGDVTGFDASDVSATNATVTGFASSSASVYTFNVQPTAEGAVTVQVAADLASSTNASTTGNQASNVLNFVYDTTAPAISSVAVATTSGTATITWTTDEAATGNVSYGATASYGASTTLETSASTTHMATVTGLSAGSTYHFQILATDSAGNSATTSNATFVTAAIAPTPVISNVMVSNLGSTTATITWNTDIAADAQVMYGTTSAYGSSSTLNTTASTTHSVVLSGLSEGTVYHFSVVSANGSSTASSSDQTFITQSTASSTPLAVTGVTTVSSTAVANNNFADGWKWVMHLTVPDNEDAFRIRFSDWAMSSTTSFPAGGNIRLSSAQASNASTTASGMISTGTGYSDWFYLTGDASPSTPGRQIDLTIEVKIPVGTASGSYTTTYTAQSYPQTATSTAI